MQQPSFLIKPIYVLSFVLSFSLCAFLSASGQVFPRQVEMASLDFREPQPPLPPSLVDFEAFMRVAAEVQAYRKDRLLSLDSFIQISKEPNVVILDARSETMYKMKHLKGAVHLNFSDFTQQNLARVIPSFDTKILIYCNNNIARDEAFFPSKVVLKGDNDEKPLTLALNIPTYINLYGYGYRNVYELASLVRANNPKLSFEGERAYVFGMPQAVYPALPIKH